MKQTNTAPNTVPTSEQCNKFKNFDMNRMEKSIANFNPKFWKDLDITKEDLQNDYLHMKEVFETLTIFEMKMIWYLRHSAKGEIYRFFTFAEKNYHLFHELHTLSKPLGE